MGFVDELEDVVVEHAIPLPCLKEKYLNFLPSNYSLLLKIPKTDEKIAMTSTMHFSYRNAIKVR